MPQKAFSKIWILIIGVVIVVGGILVYDFWRAEQRREKETSLTEKEKVEKMVKECKEAHRGNIEEQERCSNIIYTLAAIKYEDRMFCNEIGDLCYECACQAIVNVLPQRSSQMKVIIGPREELLQRESMLSKFERLYGSSEIKTLVTARCGRICEGKISPVENPQDFNVIVKMSDIRVMAEIYEGKTGSYDGFSCNATRELSKLCDDIKQIVGVRPTINAQGNKYCSYVKLKKEGKYYCIDSAGKALKTTINPSGGYCSSTSFRCPPK